MSAIVQIPQPCHASWDKMQAQENGRHCKACDKVVIDFSQMNDQELIAWLKDKAHEKVCGHFKSEQVDRLEIVVQPKEFKRLNWSPKHIIQIAIFLVFSASLFSCNSNANNGAIPQIIVQSDCISDTSKKTQQALPESSYRGKVKLPEKSCTPDTLIPAKEKDHFIMGEVMYVPKETTPPATILQEEKNELIIERGIHRKAHFPNGEKALQQWIEQNKRYPEINRARMFRETVIAEVMIDTSGRPYFLKIISPENTPDVFQAEIIRLLSAMPNWKSASKSGRAIRSKTQLRFPFQMGN